MRIGECKKGDVVWCFSGIITGEPMQVEILGNSKDTTYLMPRKKVRVIYPNDEWHCKWVDELFYSTTCYHTKEDAEAACAAELNRVRNHDHADAIAASIFCDKQSKIECLERFIAKKGLMGEYIEFEKRSSENLRRANPILDELKKYGTNG